MSPVRAAHFSKKNTKSTKISAEINQSQVNVGRQYNHVNRQCMPKEAYMQDIFMRGSRRKFFRGSQTLTFFVVVF